jgi:pentatricopeptide repeat protein
MIAALGAGRRPRAAETVLRRMAACGACVARACAFSCLLPARVHARLLAAQRATRPAAATPPLRPRAAARSHTRTRTQHVHAPQARPVFRFPVFPHPLPFSLFPPGCAPDAVAYNAVVHAWCASGAPAEAERCLAAMRAAGLQPTDSTYTELLAALAAAGRTDRAEKYLVRCVARAKRMQKRLNLRPVFRVCECSESPECFATSLG